MLLIFGRHVIFGLSIVYDGINVFKDIEGKGRLALLYCIRKLWFDNVILDGVSIFHKMTRS